MCYYLFKHIWIQKFHSSNHYGITKTSMGITIDLGKWMIAVSYQKREKWVNK